MSWTIEVCVQLDSGQVTDLAIAYIPHSQKQKTKILFGCIRSVLWVIVHLDSEALSNEQIILPERLQNE